MTGGKVGLSDYVSGQTPAIVLGEGYWRGVDRGRCTRRIDSVGHPSFHPSSAFRLRRMSDPAPGDGMSGVAGERIWSRVIPESPLREGVELCVGLGGEARLGASHIMMLEST